MQLISIRNICHCIGKMVHGSDSDDAAIEAVFFRKEHSRY
jgi:hypothetical protein